MDASYANERLSLWCLRANRGLKQLIIRLPDDSTWWDVAWMSRRCHQLRHTLLHLDGGANMQVIAFRASELSGFSFAALSCFCDSFLRPSVQTGYLNSRTQSVLCDIQIPWVLFPISSGFLQYFAAVDQLRISSFPANRLLQANLQHEFAELTRTHLSGPTQPMYSDPRMPARTRSMQLHTLAMLPGSRPPLFSHLCELSLTQCQADASFYYLLASAAPSLEFLHISNVGWWPSDLRQIPPEEYFSPADPDYLTNHPDLDEEDLDEWHPGRNRCCIVLHRLKEFRQSGPKTVSWWQSDVLHTPGVPDVYMPDLRSCILRDQDRLDQAAEPRITQSPRRQQALHFQIEAGELAEVLEGFDEEGDFNNNLPPLTALWNLLSSSSCIQVLDLSGSVVSDISLRQAFRFAPALKSLAMRDMPDLTEWAGRALAYLPQLEQLDLRGTDISAVSVAKTHEALRDRGGGLKRVQMDDPGPFYEDEVGYVTHVAFTWLDYIGVIDDWPARAYTKSQLKQPWADRNLLEETPLSSLEG